MRVTSTDDMIEPEDGWPEVNFLRFTDHGKVHVFKQRWTINDTLNKIDGIEPEPEDDDPPLIDMRYETLYARQRAYCGEMGEPGQMYGLEAFLDDELCVRCAAAFPLPSQLLFEHPVPNGDDEG